MSPSSRMLLEYKPVNDKSGDGVGVGGGAT